MMTTTYLLMIGFVIEAIGLMMLVCRLKEWYALIKRQQKITQYFIEDNQIMVDFITEIIHSPQTPETSNHIINMGKTMKNHYDSWQSFFDKTLNSVPYTKNNKSFVNHDL